jgi:uncharacterized RDD family membrane protein YckC
MLFRGAHSSIVVEACGGIGRLGQGIFFPNVNGYFLLYNTIILWNFMTTACAQKKRPIEFLCYPNVVRYLFLQIMNRKINSLFLFV